MNKLYSKVCSICGDSFTSESQSKRICPKDHYAKCPICGNQFIWNSKQATPACSKQCRKEQTKRKNLEKYGVEHPMQSPEVRKHHRQAMLDKYGVESPLQSKEIRQRAIDTNLEKFGTAWALGNKDIKKKAQETMIQKYGAATTLESPVLRKKVEATCIEKYGVPTVFQSKEIQAKITNANFLKYGVANAMQNPDTWKKAHQTRIDKYGEFWPAEIDEAARRTNLERYGYDNASKSPEIKAKIKDVLVDRYGENYGSHLTRNAGLAHDVISNINRAFMSKLEERGIRGEFEFSGHKRYRYDIVVPERKILVEINPTYTHNAIGNHWSDQGLPISYHKEKTEAAVEMGYQCINVFDWDDWDKIIDLIAQRKTVYARQCEIYKLQTKVAIDFLNKYHLQGSVTKQVLCLGLVKDGELLQVMTFGEPRYNKHYSTELLRLCSKQGVTVVGGASKLFKFATDYIGLDDIISYCDLSKFTGEVYTKIGMKWKENTDPQEVWSKDDRKITANLLRKRGYDQLFGTEYGKGTSNSELMLQDGWLPVYDCGQAVYTYSSREN